MPLKSGSSQKVVSENISEFHKGPTYAKTAAKFGKKKADAQAIAVALSTARRYGKKKQDGGEVEEKKEPELRSYSPSFYDRARWGASDVLRGLGADRYNANKLGTMAADVASYLPITGNIMSGAEIDPKAGLLHNIGHGIGAVIGPAGGLARSALPKASKTASEAAESFDSSRRQFMGGAGAAALASAIPAKFLSKALASRPVNMALITPVFQQSYFPMSGGYAYRLLKSMTDGAPLNKDKVFSAIEKYNSSNPGAPLTNREFLPFLEKHGGAWGFVDEEANAAFQAYKKAHPDEYNWNFYADGGEVEGEVNPFNIGQPAATLEHTEEGFPFYQAKRQPVPHSALRFVESLRDRWNQPAPIKPAAQPPQPQPIQPRPDEQLGQVGKHLIEGYKDYFDPFAKDEEGKYIAEQPIPETPSGKVPQAQKDYLAPVIGGLDIGSNLIGIPTAIASGMSKAAIAFGLKAAISQAHTKIPKLTGHEIAHLVDQAAFLDTSGFKQVGHQLGFMPGGVYTAPDGAAYYLKVGPSIEQVKNEQLASVLYRLAGTPAAEVNITSVSGHPGIASKMLQNSHQLSEAKEPYNQIKGLHENFVVDAWLANHDAVGTGGENPLGNIMIQNGMAYRIDGGGALRFKGSGDPKKHFNDEADEIFSMRDPNFSKRSAQVFGDISQEDLIKGAQKVADIDEVELSKAITLYGPSDPNEQQALLVKLLKRRQYIMDQFGVKPKGAATPAPERPSFEEAFPQFFKKESPPTLSFPKFGGQSEALDAFYSGSFNDNVGRLAPNEVKSIKSYGGVTNSWEVNKALRENKATPEIWDIVSGLDQIMSRSSINQDITLYRAIGYPGWAPDQKKAGKPIYEKLSNMKPGEKFTDAAYLSTSAMGSSSSSLIKINVPKGSRGMINKKTWEDDGEYEVILDRGSRLVALGKDDFGRPTFRLEQDAKAPSSTPYPQTYEAAKAAEQAENIKKYVHKDPLGDYIEYQLPSGEKITSKTPIAAYEPPKAEPYRGEDPYQAIATDMPPEYWSKVEKDAARQDQMVGEKDFSEGYIPPVNALGEIDEGVTRTTKPKIPLTHVDVIQHPFSDSKTGKKLSLNQMKALWDKDDLDKKTAKSLSKSLESDSGPAMIAGDLWYIAENMGPHKAEAIYRALDEAKQSSVGEHISALKKAVGKSPWDDMSGGKYLVAKALEHKPKALLLDEYIKSVTGISPNGKDTAKKKKAMLFKGQDKAKAAPVLDPKADANKIVAETKSDPSKMALKLYDKAIYNPHHADEIFKLFPEHLQPEVNMALDDVLNKRKYHPWKAPFAKQEEIKRIIFEMGKPINWQSYKPIYQKGIKPIEWGPVSKSIIKSLGFGTEFPLFHGKSSIPKEVGIKYKVAETGGWSSKFFYDPAKTPIPEVERYPAEILKPSSKKPYEQAFFLSDNPQIAKTYGPNVLPFLARPKKAFRIDWPTITGTQAWYDGDVMERVIDAARSQGADMLILERIADIPGNTMQTQYLVFNPAILRGPKAKFDPTKLHLRYPLAGLAGAAVVGGGTLAYGDLEEEKMNRGGFARGGMGSAPWNTRKGTHPSGLIKSTVPGRTDKIPMNLKSGSYVIPAETVSALGENNTLAGGEILNRMLKSGPYGSKLPTANKGRAKLPRISMPSGKKMPTLPKLPRPKFADGGEATVPIIAAGGEFVVDPETVTNIGNGNMDAGHRVLDKLVLGVRKRHIETLRKLKPPKQ